MTKHAIRTDRVYPNTMPSGCPPHGISVPAVVRGVITCDRLLVDLYDEFEVELILIGIEPADSVMPENNESSSVRLTAAARHARDRVHDMIEAAQSQRHDVFLPRPRYVRGWLHSMKPGRKQSGLLYLAGDSCSLNSRIHSEGLCNTNPDCDYLRSDWNQPRPVPWLTAHA